MSTRRAVPTATFVVALTFLLLQAPVLGHAEREATTTQTPPHTKTKILVRDNYFEPRSVEVVEGRHLGWKWKGENRHNIRFTKVPKGASRKGASTRIEGYWKRKFRKPGTYRYVCKHWAGMRGTVTVRPESKPEPSSTAQ